MFVNPSVLFLLSLLDGQHTLADMQIKYNRHFGEVLSQDQLDGIIDHLDEHLFLNNDRFMAARQNTEEKFRRTPIRDAAHAGTAYADNAEDLDKQLKAFYAASGGPGSTSVSSGEQIKGIIAPHIDFHRGGPCYTWAYRELASSLDADLFIILGIGHSGPRRLFTMTPKDFSTPFGTIRTDQDFVNQVQTLCPFDIFEDEFLHKYEHSIEFQVVFLQSILRDRPDTMIVPILCGSFHKMVVSGDFAFTERRLSGFC